MISTSNDLAIIKRELEIITEAFESIQEIADYLDTKDAGKLISATMIPLCLNLEGITEKLSLHSTSINVREVKGRKHIPLMNNGRGKNPARKE